MRPLFPYMGGKAPVREALTQIMMSRPHQTYIEAFLGSGAVFYATPKAKISVLNDDDPDVLGIHTAIASDYQAVMTERQRLVVGRPTYRQIQTERRSPNWCDLPDAQRAARMMYIFSCAVNAKQDSPFPASATRPINYDPDKDLQPYADKLKGITFECLDWSELLDRYVLQPTSISCMLYADPPYVVSQKGKHYGRNFTVIDHVMLARKLALINKRNGAARSVGTVVTYDDDESGLIRSLYRPEFGWHIRPLSVKYKSGHHAHATNELLITNFETGEKT